MCSSAPELKDIPNDVPFILLQLANEAIRAGVRECQDTVDELDLKQFKVLFPPLSHCVHTVARMKGNGFFPMLDQEFNDKLLAAKLYSNHVEESTFRRMLKEVRMPVHTLTRVKIHNMSKNGIIIRYR